MFLKYRPAIIFLLKYIGVYLVLNTLYAFYIESKRPDSDEMTRMVTRHSAAVLNLFDDHITSKIQPGSIYVPIQKNAQTVIEVFEGCNSINVLIVFVAFIVAFRGPINKFLYFLLAGAIVIYVVNLLRIMALYLVAMHIPQALYFFHKFLFTGIIYLIVFAMWYYWTVIVKEWRKNQA